MPKPLPILVWFKRDLRVTDHRPLFAAAAQGPVLPVYVLEPSLWGQEDASARQFGFVRESVRELAESLDALGVPLTILIGELPEAFADLWQSHPFRGIYSHEETGNGLTYARDLRVQAFAKERGLAYEEWPQNGVVRRLKDRDGWSRRWLARMSERLTLAPTQLQGPAVPPQSARWPQATALGLREEDAPRRQTGGASVGEATLWSFLHQRGAHYTKGMSSPLTAYEQCSRVSPYLAQGCLSLRAVWQKTAERRAELKALRQAKEAPSGPWASALSSFDKRLRWHCHFMQKLEDEPALEFHALAQAYEHLRPMEADSLRLQAFREGRTGYPMVDACMRALQETGWINFRMRAMLMSFASYHLWLPWRESGLVLARLFVDYEPGIHWSQVQMQSGTTGINTFRIYSPKKQLEDHDPDGAFVKRYVPELAGVPLKRLAEPFRLTASEQEAAGCHVGVDYPTPIVEHQSAVKAAKDALWAVRKDPATRAEAAQVLETHGSRKRPSRRREASG